MTSKEMKKNNIVNATVSLSAIINPANNKDAISKRRILFNAIIKNCQTITYDEDGKPGLCSCDIPIDLLFVDDRYQGNRNHKKLSKLLSKWNTLKLMPIIVVPHFETCTFAVVDGKGRTMAAKIKNLETLPALAIMNAPREDNEERLKFEASYFSEQGTEVEKIKKYEQHQALVINGDEAAVVLDTLCKKYGIIICDGKGQRQPGVLGSYGETYNMAKSGGSEMIDFIFGIIENAGWRKEKNGYGTFVMRSLKTAYLVHPDKRPEVFDFLSKELRQIDPELFGGNAKARYPKRDYRIACTLYIEDLICEGLNIERSVFIEHDKFIIKKGV